METSPQEISTSSEHLQKSSEREARHGYFCSQLYNQKTLEGSDSEANLAHQRALEGSDSEAQNFALSETVFADDWLVNFVAYLQTWALTPDRSNSRPIPACLTTHIGFGLQCTSSSSTWWHATHDGSSLRQKSKRDCPDNTKNCSASL